MSNRLYKRNQKGIKMNDMAHTPIDRFLEEFPEFKDRPKLLEKLASIEKEMLERRREIRAMLRLKI